MDILAADDHRCGSLVLVSCKRATAASVAPLDGKRPDIASLGSGPRHDPLRSCDIHTYTCSRCYIKYGYSRLLFIPRALHLQILCRRAVTRVLGATISCPRASNLSK